MRTVQRTTVAIALAVGFLVGLCRPGLLLAQSDGRDDDRHRAELWRSIAPHFAPPADFAGNLDKFRSPLLRADGRRVESVEEWHELRKQIERLWLLRLGKWPPLLERPKVEKLETVKRDGYSGHRVRVEVSDDGHVVEGYLLVPHLGGPLPAVLVPFYEPLTSIGRGEAGQGTHDYGSQLVKRGIVTLSIGTPGTQDAVGGDTRKLLTQLGIDERRQPLGLLAYVAANCHTALSQMQEVDPKRIGIVGFSYGGKWSMFASCLHEKFACAVWSDPGIVFNETNSNVNYWEPWYLGYDARVTRKAGVPSESNPRTGLYKQLVEHGEDLVSLHALMAPRPVLVSGGTEDPPSNWLALNHLVELCGLLCTDERVAMTSRDTHRPTPEALKVELDFLEYWLKYGLQNGN